MLELRPVCEHCNKSLPPDSKDAMICTYECTFCATCVADVLHNVCPNCGGGFVPRPVRPKDQLIKYPPTTKEVHKPVDIKEFSALLFRFKDIPADKR